jgi:hypothetical protein
MTGTTGRTRWLTGRLTRSRGFASTMARDRWAIGSLLPFGWRPDRDDPPEDHHDRRCVVVDRAVICAASTAPTSHPPTFGSWDAGACPGIGDASAGF